MGKTVTVTTNRQITIPVALSRSTGIKPGEKLYVESKDGRIVLTPLSGLVQELAGSIEVPEKYQGLDMDTLIKETKQDHFADKRT